MRRALTMVCVAAMLALGICAGALAGPHSRASTFSAVQASGAEFHINLSRGKIQPGKLRLEFVNYGEDDHDLAVRRVGTSLVRNLGTTHPGDRAVKRFKVRRGTYKLWCTLSNHRSLGMSATLKVRKSS
jgi:plastocyanin